MTRRIVDTFAGPGGWDEGMRLIGRRDVLGIEWCKWACKTAEAAGHRRLHGDVSLLTPIDCVGHISSPPCTKFSSAGTGVGVLLIDMLADGIRRIFAGEDCRAGVREDAYPICLAERERANEARKPSKRWSLERVEKAARNDAFTSCLVLEPARWIMGSPSLRWVALEQVRQVLPLWEVYAECLRARGFSVWCGLLNSADYGVPQTRIRAILTASLDVRCERPEPTHAQHPIPSLFGTPSGWVPMAEALGWGFDEPSATVSSEETFDATDEPAPTVLFGHRSNDVRWALDRPATTVVGSFRPDVIAGPGHHDTSRQDAPGSVRVTVQEAAILQSFRPDYEWDGLRPAPHVGCGFSVEDHDAFSNELKRDGIQRGVHFVVRGFAGEDDKVLQSVVMLDTVDVVDNLLRLRPGHHAVLRDKRSPGEDIAPIDPEIGRLLPSAIRVERVTSEPPLLPVLGTEPASDGLAFAVLARWLGGVPIPRVGGPALADSLVVHQAEPLGGVLSATVFDLADPHVSNTTRPAGNSRTKQYEQCGNAIPPRLAAHVVASAIGIDPTAAIDRYYAEALGGAA